LEIYYPFINPIVNPADILPVRGIPKLVIANEVVAAAWPSTVLPLLVPGICIVRNGSHSIAEYLYLHEILGNIQNLG
jgi:hypothetical protein